MKQNSEPPFADWFKTIAEYAVAVTLVSTICSLAVNFFLFDVWGVPFATIVTPSDVVVGGVEGLKIFLPLAFDVYIARDFQQLWKRLNVTKTSAIYLTMIALLLFGFVSAIDLAPDLKGISQIANGYLTFTIRHLLIISLISLVMFRWSIGEKKSEKRHLTEIGAMFVIILGGFHIGIEAKNRNLNLVVSGVSSRCQGKEYVVWAGNYSLLTSCEISPYSRADRFFILKREGLEFETFETKPRIFDAQTH